MQIRFLHVLLVLRGEFGSRAGSWKIKIQLKLKYDASKSSGMQQKPVQNWVRTKREGVWKTFSLENGPRTCDMKQEI